MLQCLSEGNGKVLTDLEQLNELETHAWEEREQTEIHIVEGGYNLNALYVRRMKYNKSALDDATAYASVCGVQ